MADVKPNRKMLVKSADQQRKKLVKLLRELKGAIRARSVQRKYSPFPFGQMEQGIAKILDVFEQKMLIKKWAEQKLKRDSR